MPQRRHWKLLIIEQEPIRRAAVLAYQQAGERVADLRRTIERHSSKDRPAYISWLSATFGALLTEFRELTGQIEEKDAMLGAMRMMTMLGGLSHYEAYQKILRSRAAVENFAAAQASDAEEEEEANEDDLQEEDKIFAGIFEDMFGIPMPDELRSAPLPGHTGTDGERKAGRGKARQQGNIPPGKAGSAQTGCVKPEQTSGQRLKTVYRTLVRRLHPDMNPDLSDYDRQLWHEAQSAYEAGDAERLETILAVSELARAGDLPAGSGLAGLLEMTRQLDASAKCLEKQVRGLKKDVSWNFTNLVSRDKLQRKVEVMLRRDVEMTRTRWTMIQREFAIYENATPPKRRNKGPAATRVRRNTPRRTG